jgi:hypothetical protein
MNTLRYVCCLLTVISFFSGFKVSHAELLALEEFNYSSIGSDLTGNSGGGSFGFTNSWSGNTSYNIGNGSLVSNLAPLPQQGNSVSAVAYPENRDIDRDLVTPWGADDTSMYLSVLMKPTGILHQGAYGGWFGLALRGSTDVVIGMNFQHNNYGLRVGGEYVQSNIPAVIGTTTFLVLRIDFTEGVDPCYLYVNPFPGTAEPPTAPSVSLIDLGFINLTRLSLTGPGGVAMDSIRIGTSYADVAPATSDFDENGYVDGSDLDNWQDGYGTTANATHTQGDADGDGDVDGRDMLIWQRQFGAGTPPAIASASIPEPSSAIVASLLWAIATSSWRTQLVSRDSKRQRKGAGPSQGNHESFESPE